MEKNLYLAWIQYRQGNYHLTVEYTRRFLAENPDHAEAHAILSLGLIQMNRPHAARHEAQIALSLDPQLPSGHFALAEIFMALRKFKLAEEHSDAYLALEPEATDGYLQKARLRNLQRRGKEALSFLMKSRELDPEDPDLKTYLGNHYLRAGQIEKAENEVREVLREYPEHLDALTLMGKIHLRKGDVREAREHALWAMRQNPNDRDVLFLFSAIKARQSWLLGLWWRFQTRMSEFGSNTSIVILLSAFMLYRIAIIFLKQNSMENLTGPVNIVWLGLCLYTWIGPSIFNKSLEKEMAAVELRDDF